jgi:hypothetical protein
MTPSRGIGSTAISKLRELINGAERSTSNRQR